MSLIFERLNTIHAEYELPTWNDGVDLTEGLFGLSWFVVLGCSWTVLLEYAPIAYSSMMIDGFPRFSYYVVFITHSTFITLSFWGFYNNPTKEYLESNWVSEPVSTASPGRFADGIAILCLIGNLAKDFPTMGSNPDIMLHHVACIGSSALMIYLQPPGVPIFIITTACLEFGSVIYGLARLCYNSKLVALIYAVLFTLSNIAGLVGGTMFVMLPDPEHTGTLVFKYVVYIITVGLCILRQLDMHKTVKGVFAGTPAFPIDFPEGHPDAPPAGKDETKKSI